MHTVYIDWLRQLPLTRRSLERPVNRISDNRAGFEYRKCFPIDDPRTFPRRFEALDGLRGVAVLAVLLYHLGISSGTGGWLGVDVFFVISGFVVTTSLLRSASRADWSVRHYFWRRFSRLMPTVFVALLVLAGMSHWIPSAIVVVPTELLAAATMTYNLALVGGLASGEYLAHIWSLSVEWHFYLGAPLLLMAVARFRNAKLAWVLLSFAVLVAIGRFVVVAQFNHPRFAYVFTPLHIDGLLLGCALATLPLATLKRIPAWTSWAGILTLVILLTVAPRWASSPLNSLGILTVLAAIATGSIIAAEARDALPGTLSKGLNNVFLQWMGQRSYSLYVWHYILAVGFVGQGKEVFMGFPGVVIQLALSLAAAEISYRFVEIPGQNWLNRWYSALHSARPAQRISP